MKKIIRLTESELITLVKKVINEQQTSPWKKPVKKLRNEMSDGLRLYSTRDGYQPVKEYQNPPTDEAIYENGLAKILVTVDIDKYEFDCQTNSFREKKLGKLDPQRLYNRKYGQILLNEYCVRNKNSGVFVPNLGSFSLTDEPGIESEIG